MTVKVILYRRVPEKIEKELKPLLLRLRSLAMAQPGYVSGETLMNADDPEEVLVISTWASLGQWNDWLANPERLRVQEQVDGLLGENTYYQVYYNA